MTIKNGFQSRRLGDLIVEAANGFASGEREQDGTIQVRMNNVDLNGNLDLSDCTRVPATKSQIAQFQVRAGDVLFNNTNSRELVGKTALFRDYSEPVLFSNHFTRLRVDGRALDPGYLSRWLTNQQQKGVFQELCNRWVNQSSVRKEALLNLTIPVPSTLEEQERIAAILDKADAIRRKRRETVERVKVFIHSVFAEMFARGIRDASGGHSPMNWSSSTVDQVKAATQYSCVGGPFGSDLTANDYVNEPGIPVIRGMNLSDESPYMNEEEFVFVSEDKAKELSKCAAVRGDIVVSQRGARLAGQVGLIADDSRFPVYVISQSQMKITVDHAQIDPIFLIYYLQSAWAVREMERRMISTGVPHINLGILKSFPVYVPPMELQHKFRSVWSKHRSLLVSFSHGLSESKRLFESLVQRAFRGEL